jgi:hypothetical protein
MKAIRLVATVYLDIMVPAAKLALPAIMAIPKRMAITASHANVLEILTLTRLAHAIASLDYVCSA